VNTFDLQNPSKMAKEDNAIDVCLTLSSDSQQEKDDDDVERRKQKMTTKRKFQQHFRESWLHEKLFKGVALLFFLFYNKLTYQPLFIML